MVLANFPAIRPAPSIPIFIHFLLQRYSAANSSRAVRTYSGILFLLAFITVNIGIVNLMPLPALDGGHLFLHAIEVIRRKPVKKEIEGMINFIGLIIILTLAVLIAIKDIIAL